MWYFFFFQAEDGIRDATVTGVQTCALPISPLAGTSRSACPLLRLSRDLSGDVHERPERRRPLSPDVQEAFTIPSSAHSHAGRLVARYRNERRETLLYLVLAVALGTLGHLSLVLLDVHRRGEPLLAPAAIELIDRHAASRGALGVRGAAAPARS